MSDVLVYCDPSGSDALRCRILGRVRNRLEQMRQEKFTHRERSLHQARVLICIAYTKRRDHGKKSVFLVFEFALNTASFRFITQKLISRQRLVTPIFGEPVRLRTIPESKIDRS